MNKKFLNNKKSKDFLGKFFSDLIIFYRATVYDISGKQQHNIDW